MISEIYKKLSTRSININQILGSIVILSTFFLIIFFPDYANPDYPSYLKLYKWGDFYSKLNLHQLSLFTSITSILNDYISYESFRYLLAIIQVICFSIVFYKLKFSYSNFTFFTCLPVAAFFLLKVHIQIRETIAILFWLFAILDINKKNFFNPKNALFLMIGCFMHISVLFWWIPSIIFSIKKISGKLKVFLFSIFFGVVGTFAGSSLFKVFVDEILSNKESITFFKQISKFPEKNMIFIHGPSISFPTVEITQIKIVYWLSYFLLITFIYLDEKRSKTEIYRYNFRQDTTSLFGFMGLYGSIVFLPLATLFSWIEGFTSHGYNYIFRILFVLLFSLCFYRSLTRPNNILTKAINFLIFLDISRLLFYQIDLFLKSYLF